MGSSPEAQRVLKPQAFDEKAYDRERKAKQRASGRELYIPVPKNIPLRLACLADHELLLKTYFPENYDEPFTEDRRAMLGSIRHAAINGGDQSIAASRGEGKTTLAMDGAFCLMLAGLTFFPVVIGKNQDAASDELKALRERITASERFIEDFPEIGIPLEAVGASTANARLQTVGGKYARMHLGVKCFALPQIAKEQLPHWPAGLEPVSRGQIMGALGIDGRIRGFKFRGHRPTLALIDDIEDAETCESDKEIEKNQKKIEKDIAGLGRSAKRIARVMLCTIQNRKCIAYVYTDPKQKPSWRGKRYRKMIKPPGRTDLVEQYVELRRNRDESDPDARVAFRFWIEHRDEIEHDCIISNPYSYNKEKHSDGQPLEVSAIQSYYNRVADFGQLAVSTEIDNDPPEEVGPQDNGLTAQIVASRISGLAKLQLPANTTALTAAIDLGQYYCHWVVTGWWTGAGGVVVDYGFVSVLGAEKNQGLNASELLIYQALLNWREELLNKNYTDATGVVRKIDRCFVDSGDFTNAAYEFCRQVRGPFHPSKGQSPFHQKTKSSETLKAGSDVYAQWQESEKVWLHHLNTDYWKSFIHERFLTPTFDEQNMLRRGSLSLYHTEKAHSMYSQHIVAEQYLTEFKEGKGEKKYWHKVGPDNHWLDCYDDKTDVLTYEGWKRFDAITECDELATVNLQTDQIEYQRPSAIVCNPYEGEMVQIGGEKFSRVNLCVTPNHRMVVLEGQAGKGPVVKLAKDLTIWDKIKTQSQWTGVCRQSVRIEKTRIQPARDVDAIALAEFLGWYIAEGSCIRNAKTGGCRISIAQNPGAKFDEIVEVAKKLPWTFSTDRRAIHWSNEQLFNVVEVLGNKYTKRVPQWIKDSSKEIIDAFVRCAVSGDGWRQRNSESYATVSPGLSDDMQELYLKLGYGVSSRIVPAKAYCIDGRCGTNTVDQHHVCRVTRKYAQLRDANNRPNFKRVPYAGYVYCATVPNGTLIVRRGGKVAICGNCTYMAAAAAEAMGIRLLAPSEVPVVAKPKTQAPKPQQHGRFKQREGGWVAGLRRRR